MKTNAKKSKAVTGEKKLVFTVDEWVAFFVVFRLWAKKFVSDKVQKISKAFFRTELSGSLEYLTFWFKASFLNSVHVWQMSNFCNLALFVLSLEVNKDLLSKL